MLPTRCIGFSRVGKEVFQCRTTQLVNPARRTQNLSKNAGPLRRSRQPTTIGYI